MFAAVAELSGGPVCGRMLHGWLFDVVAAGDPGLADRLHAPDRPRPFAWAILPGSDADAPAVRLSVWDEALADVLGRAFPAAAGDTVRIGGRDRSVRRVFGPDDPHPWCGRTTWDALRRHADDVAALTVEFASATVFRAGDRDLAEPLPRLIVGSWRRSWRAAGGPDPPDDDTAGPVLAEAAVRPALGGPDGRLAGFVGVVTLSAAGLPEPSRRTLSALSAFAFYCGTGRKTAMAMGLTRRVR
jgi:CRISPR-associated endoribonuclease Cas6